jgi:hypothetical protein
MLKADVLDLNAADNATSKLCELAAQRYTSLCPKGGRSELTCHSTTNTEEEEKDYNSHEQIRFVPSEYLP